MRDWKSLLLVLLISSAVVYETYAFSGPATGKHRLKRWYEGECKEKVLQRSPECEKEICDENGQKQFLYYPCPTLPKDCPKKVIDNEAECCPEKCVCGDGDTMYAPGEKFEVVRGARILECECGQDEVPSCTEIFKVPPKEPNRPPPVFPPPGLFPPGEFPPKRDWDEE